MSTSTTQNPGNKAVRLIDYLLRLATLRAKLIRDIFEYDKVLWISDIPLEHECFTQAWGSDEEHEAENWIEAENRQEPEVPAIPVQCENWIHQATLLNKDEIPELFPETTRFIQNPDWQEGADCPETVEHTEQIENHPTIQREWSKYIEEKWLPWSKLHTTWEKVHQVYSLLFSIHQEQLRLGEEYELILGLGLLTWQTASGQQIRRHVVVADACLEFDARLGKFTVHPHPEGANIRPELDMLDIDERPARAEESARKTLLKAEDNPWEKELIQGVLQALVHSINSEGSYIDSLETSAITASSKPVVDYAPALILRKRSAKGLTETLNGIKEQIKNGDAIPSEFADIAEIQPENKPEQDDSAAEKDTAFRGEIFFPRLSNDEQRRIVDKIHTESGILVQGPPGTGKSHTIANLISHLLATGQRTLITAKTPRALQVLEGLVPDELRPLCINLLGNGLEERRSLESSVGGILRKNEAWKEECAAREREALEDRLYSLREEKTEIIRRLRDIRESETQTQSIAEGSYRGTAARVAEAVRRDRAIYGWFLDLVPSEKSCEVSRRELLNLLKSLRFFTQEKRKELSLLWPNTLLASKSFKDLVQNEADAIEQEVKAKSGADEHFADLLVKESPSAIDKICDALSRLRKTKKKLAARPHSWMNGAIADILGDHSSLWQELFRVTQHTISSAEKEASLADSTKIEFPENSDINTLYTDAKKLITHLNSGGHLGWSLFRPKLVKERLYVINSVKVGGHLCVTTNHLSTLINVLNVRIECEKAWNFWADRTDRENGPYALQLMKLKLLGHELQSALLLEDQAKECNVAMQRCPNIAMPVWTDASQIEKIILSCHLASARIKSRFASQEIQFVETPVRSLAHGENIHPITTDLLTAICDRNVDRFLQCTNKIQALKKEQLQLEELEELLQELRQQLPRLTDALETTPQESCWEERIEHIGDAWHWAQARYWIEEYIRKDDVPALNKRTKQIETDENEIIAKLAALHAWSFCFSRLKEDHRRHMEAWQQSMRRLGKGTGKHAHRHRSEAQEHLNKCREAVPAWVMPLHRVWDTVSPAPGIFDVIIVDEASQCGIEALPLFYLGKKILIVGDDKQISPDIVGLPRDAVQRLMQEFLYDFQFKSSFDIESSLFDHGKLRYGTRQITLREHFRCMPEIIRFSNNLSYSDTPLIPLRQYGPDRLAPLEHVFVHDGHRETTNNQAINRPEAKAIVNSIVEMCKDERYDEMSIGVVVLQGETQAALIENQLLEQLGAEEMERRNLVCGNPYSFQGDERDIIFLSLVAANNERIGTLTKAADERRFNVAASRARDRMILFHSVSSDELSTTCLRRRLLSFFEEKKEQPATNIDREELERHADQSNRHIIKPLKPFDSWFEVDVARELLHKNYSIVPQYEVAGKRIDIVVEGGEARLAIECDGDHWEGAEQYEVDMKRQRQLERCGWEFFRIRESVFYSDKNAALNGLWQALEERNILQQRPEDEAPKETACQDEQPNNDEYKKHENAPSSPSSDAEKEVNQSQDSPVAK